MSNEDLARRAVACEGWRWMSGQPVIDPHGVRKYVVNTHGRGAWVARAASVSWLSDEVLTRCLPDLTDPATLGCLLALVRAAWDDPAAWAAPDGDWHVFGDMPETEYGIGDTEAAALVAALEAAP